MEETVKTKERWVAKFWSVVATKAKRWPSCGGGRLAKGDGYRGS